jgi:glycerol uptake facilitator-like aquaporin
MTVAYVAWVGGVWLVFFGIAFGLTVVLLKGERKPHALAMVAAIYGAGCLMVAILDKFCDERFRKLEKIS